MAPQKWAYAARNTGRDGRHGCRAHSLRPDGKSPDERHGTARPCGRTDLRLFQSSYVEVGSRSLARPMRFDLGALRPPGDWMWYSDCIGVDELRFGSVENGDAVRSQ